MRGPMCVSIVAAVLVLTSCGSAPESTAGKVEASSGPDGSASSQPTATTPAKSELELFRDYLDEVYGTFEPLELSGKGDSMTILPDGVNFGIGTVRMAPGSDIAVTGEAITSERETVLYWSLEDYPEETASFLMLGEEGLKTRVLYVEAKGNWSITLEPLSSASELALPATGIGSDVFLYLGEPGAWEVDASGPGSDIYLEAYHLGDTEDQGTKPLAVAWDVQELPFSGQWVGTPGPAIVQVETSASWSLQFGGGSPPSPSPEPCEADSRDPIPIEDMRKALDEGFGSFEPVVFSGDMSSDRVVTFELPPSVEYGVATLTMPRGLRFGLKGFSSDGEFTFGVSTIASRVTETQWLMFRGGPNSKLEVQTPAGLSPGQEWSLKIEPLSSAAEMTLPLEGSHSGVYLYPGGIGSWNSDVAFGDEERQFDVSYYGFSGLKAISNGDGPTDIDFLDFGDMTYGEPFGTPCPALVSVETDDPAWRLVPAN